MSFCKWVAALALAMVAALVAVPAAAQQAVGPQRWGLFHRDGRSVQPAEPLNRGKDGNVEVVEVRVWNDVRADLTCEGAIEAPRWISTPMPTMRPAQQGVRTRGLIFVRPVTDVVVCSLDGQEHTFGVTIPALGSTLPERVSTVETRVTGVERKLGSGRDFLVEAGGVVGFAAKTGGFGLGLAYRPLGARTDSGVLRFEAWGNTWATWGHIQAANSSIKPADAYSQLVSWAAVFGPALVIDPGARKNKPGPVELAVRAGVGGGAFVAPDHLVAVRRDGTVITDDSLNQRSFVGRIEVAARVFIDRVFLSAAVGANGATAKPRMGGEGTRTAPLADFDARFNAGIGF